MCLCLCLCLGGMYTVPWPLLPDDQLPRMQAAGKYLVGMNEQFWYGSMTVVLICQSVCIHTCIYACAYMYIRACINTHKHTDTHTYAQFFECAQQIQSAHRCAHINMTHASRFYMHILTFTYHIYRSFERSLHIRGAHHTGSRSGSIYQ